MNVVFNEIDPVACAVLRDCHDGTVLERSVKDLQSADLAGYERAHFFAGAGLWEVACELAGWVGPIWTGSCPCQGESVAGKRLGARDPRDLWPDFFTLIAACRPSVVVGEQVDAAVSSHWLDRTASDLEDAGYAFRAVDIPACAIDAPHKRNRIYWVAVDNADAARRLQPQGRVGTLGRWSGDADVWCSLANPSGARPLSTAHRGLCGEAQGERPRHVEFERRNGRDDVADADRRGRDRGLQDALGRTGRRDAAERADVGDICGEGLALGSFQDVERRSLRHKGSPSCATNHRSHWMDAEWLRCADGKARRSKPGLRLLVDGLAGRADLWRLAGNSIVPQITAEVLIALKETLDEVRPVRMNDLFG